MQACVTDAVITARRFQDKELTMPTIDEAMMKARHTYRDATNSDVFDNGLRAALSAFLADAPVSEGMEGTYWTLCRDVSFPEPPPPQDAYKALSAKLAEEIQ